MPTQTRIQLLSSRLFNLFQVVTITATHETLAEFPDQVAGNEGNPPGAVDPCRKAEEAAVAVVEAVR